MSNKISILDIPSNYKLTKQSHEDLLRGILFKVEESGELNPAEAFAICDTLEKIGKAGKENLRKHISDRDTAFGAEITIAGGNTAIDYADDSVIQELTEKIKERQELLKAALKNEIADVNTGEIIKPKIKNKKATITVNYK